MKKKQKPLYGLHVLVTGNPVDGLEFWGPFKTGEDAIREAETDSYFDDQSWWIAPLNAGSKP